MTKPCSLSAFAGDGDRQGLRFFQQMLERGGAGAVHGGAGGGFDSLQIEWPLPAKFGEGDMEQAVYLAGDLLMDRVRSFFSWAVEESSTRRKQQIFSLTAMKSRLSC